MEESKALGCFLTSCCCRCSGASATWDIPHDIYPGEGIDRCFKGALWHGQERPLVTLDKAGDYHINLRAVMPCWTSQCMLASQAGRLTAPWQGRKRINSLTKCSLPCAFMCLHGQLGCYCPTNMCATGCQAAVSEVWMKCTTLMMHAFLVVFTVFRTVQHVASFAIRSFCSVCDANQIKSKAVLLTDI